MSKDFIILDDVRIPVPEIDNEEGYVYVMECRETCYYKIGISKENIQKRMRGIQSSSPFEISIYLGRRIPNYKAIEVMLHQYYSSQNIRGEWFSFLEHELPDIDRVIDTFLHFFRTNKKPLVKQV